MNNNRLSDQELEEITELREDIHDIVCLIGEHTIDIIRLEEELRRIKLDRDNYLSTYNVLSQREKDIANTLSSKYGTGTINLETGVIS